MNSIHNKIERVRQEYLKEEKRKEDAKKTDVFAEVFGLFFVVAGLIALYFTLRGVLFERIINLFN
jgi:hypothetical protein